MAYKSDPGDLALHGVRVLGFATASGVAGRYGLDAAATEEYLLDFQARGWVSHHSFAGASGWSMTEEGRAENERRLAAELDKAGGRETVTAVHVTFVPLNQRLGIACSNWQLRPAGTDPMAINDHSDWRWDERVLRSLAFIEKSFWKLCGELAGCLERFSGYADRYSAALRRAEAGQRAWVDAPGRDSCHIVWIQFHEDLLATLGITRGSDN